MHTTALVPAVRPDRLAPREVAAAFRDLLREGVELRPAGEAREDPERLLRPARGPRYRLRLFQATYFLTGLRFDRDIRFLIAYIALAQPSPGGDRVRALYPRIVYKDPSLTWRVASHVILSDEGNWIGKGDVKWGRQGRERVLHSAEETSLLPYELQAALDTVSRRERARRDLQAVPLILRAAPQGRIEPYADFSLPRRCARARGRIHGGRPIARFTRPGDPSSLVFAPGYEPDFQGGLLEVARSISRMYGGAVRKFRVLSANRSVQYQLVASPRHAWVNPPQALTSELSTYGVRTLDVEVPEELCVPGYEYHYVDEHADPPTLHSQIPAGFAGDPSPVDPSRADASRWIEALPVIRRFREWLSAGDGARGRQGQGARASQAWPRASRAQATRNRSANASSMPPTSQPPSANETGR